MPSENRQEITGLLKPDRSRREIFLPLLIYLYLTQFPSRVFIISFCNAMGNLTKKNYLGIIWKAIIEGA